MRHLQTAVSIVGLSIIGAGVACILGNPSPPSRDPRIGRLESANAELRTRVDSLERHLTESVRVSHERRAALADELRSETAEAITGLAADVVGLRSDFESKVVVFGQQIAAERTVRRREIEEATGEVANFTAFLMEDQVGRILAKIRHVEDRLKAAESRTIPTAAPAKPAMSWKTIGAFAYYGYQDGDVFRYTHWASLLTPPLYMPGTCR